MSSERRLTSVRLENDGLKSRLAHGDTRVADLLAKIDALEQELSHYRANGHAHPIRALPGVRATAALGDAAGATSVASRIAAAMSSSPLAVSISSASTAAGGGGRSGTVRAGSRSSSIVRDVGEMRGILMHAATGTSGTAPDFAGTGRGQSIDKVLEDSRAVLDYVNTVLPARSNDALPITSSSLLTVVPTAASTAYKSGSTTPHVSRYTQE